MRITYNGKELFIDNKKVSFTNEISNFIEFNSYCVCLIMDDEIPDNNIYAIDYSGNVVWNISEIIQFSYQEAYVSMSKIDDNILKVISYNGVAFYIDTALNKVVRKEISK